MQVIVRMSVHCIGDVPPVLLRICAKATFFDLSENKFAFLEESGSDDGQRAYMRDIVERVHNMRDVQLVDLRNRHDLIGEQNDSGSCSSSPAHRVHCITDVAGLEYFMNLTHVNLSSCQ